MNKNNKKIKVLSLLLFTSYLSLFTFSGCQNSNLTKNISPINNNTVVSNSKFLPNNKKTELHGTISFPKTRKEEIEAFKIKSKSKFNTKANVSDIAPNATISFILPESNNVIATGLSDSTGAFTISLNAVNGDFFNPEPNRVYILEASKRIGSSGNNTMAIRTFVRWNGTYWDSITDNELRINEYTTAYTIIQGYNPSTITPESTIAKINVNGSVLTPSLIGSIPLTTINSVVGMVTSILAQSKDPVVFVKARADSFNNNTIFYLDQTSVISDLTKNNSCSSCDFSEINISNVSLAGKDLSYSNLSGKDLSNVDLSGTILIGADLTGATLPADMSYLNLESAILKNQNFTLKDLTGTNFHNADLTGAILSTTAIPKDLSKTRLSGANLTNAELSSGDFTKSYLFETVFDNTKISGAKFEKADLTGANFSTVQGSDFTGVSFTNTILIGSNFSGVNLTNVDLITANVQGSDFSKATITSKKINDNLQNCNFSEAIIDGGSIDLTTPTSFFLNADLTGSDFTKTQLKNINFENIIAKDCNFSETNFNRVNFNNSNLESSLFDKTVFASNMNIKNTIMRKSSFSLITSTFNVLIDSPDISYSSIKDSTITNFSFYTKKADYFNVLNSQFKILKQKTDFNLFDTVQNVSNTITIPKYSVPDLTLLLLSDLKAETTDPVFTSSFTLLQYPNDPDMKNDFEMTSYNGLTELNDLYSDPNNNTLDLPPPEYAIKGLSFTNTTSSIFGYFYKSKFINVIAPSFTNYCNECTIDSPNNSFSVSGAFLNSTINANSLTVQNAYLKKSTVSAVTGSILNSYLNETNYSFVNESGTNFFTRNSQNSATCSNETVVNVPHDFYFLRSGFCDFNNNKIITSTAKYKTYSKCFKNFSPDTFFLKTFPKKSLPVSSSPLCNADANFFSNNRIKYK